MTGSNENDTNKTLDRIAIHSTGLDVSACHQFLSCDEAGGQVIFVGTVRRYTDTGNTGYLNSENLGTCESTQSDGKVAPETSAIPHVIETVALEYDVYGPLALRAMKDLIAETRLRFSLTRVLLEHRQGRVEIGEPAILIGACSQHRKQAFHAVEYLIDEVKTRIPVWKREILADGGSHWVHPKPDHARS